MLKFKNIFLLTFISLLNISYATQNKVYPLDCGGDFKLSATQKAQGNAHKDVERAGVMLVKDYGKDEVGKPNSRYAVLLGHDKNIKMYNFQAGKCEAHHKYTSVVAHDELFEETGQSININSKQISASPYIYARQKQLFIVRDDSVSVRNIEKACQIAVANPTLAPKYREIDGIVAVSLADLLRVASTIPQNDRSSSYPLTSRTKDIPIQIEGHYMRMIADHKNTLKTIFNNVFPGAQF